MTIVDDILQRAADRHFGPVYSSDPVAWARDKAKVFLWSKQAEIARSVRENRYTAVRSSHDGGKSFGASVLTAWWLDTHPIGEAFVVTTAPTATQVSAILWREIEKLHRKAKLRGRVNMGNVPEWYIDKELIAYGRKPSDYDESGFQGVHSRYPLIIADEACGIPAQLWNAIDALATNDNARVLAIGNPDDSSSQFKTICDPGSGWNVIELDGLRTPNFTQENVSEFPELFRFMVDHDIPFSTEQVDAVLREHLLSVRWVHERMQRWGVRRKVNEDTGLEEWTTSSLWESKVRGRFPTDSTEGLVPLGWIEAANRRWVDMIRTIESQPGARHFGVDVARFGQDDTVLATRQGSVIDKLERYGQQDTMATANIVHNKLKHPRSQAAIDVIGIGAGVVDRLRELGDEVVGFNAGASAEGLTDHSGEWKFRNLRSAVLWNVRDLLDPAYGADLALPPDDLLTADLTSLRWKAQGDKLVVEPKEDFIKRIGRSPDSGDAVAIVCWRHTGADTTEKAVVVQYGAGMGSRLAVPWGG